MTNFGVKSAIWFGSVDANDNLYVQHLLFLQIEVFLLSLTRVTASGPHRTHNSQIIPLAFAGIFISRYKYKKKQITTQCETL